MQKITLYREDKKTVEYELNNPPDLCPYCNTGISPIPVYGFFQNITTPGINRNNVQIIFQCPIAKCRALFITQYQFSNESFYSRNDLTKHMVHQEFDKVISNISSDFITIFNQTYQAEQLGLSLIVGPGYRKSLEFLIKDYAIKSQQLKQDKENVNKAFLIDVIKNYIDDPRIISTAKRATWLGNDETHYVRKWEEKDINDLKLLIEMTTNWIILVELSKKFEDEMAEKKSKS